MSKSKSKNAKTASRNNPTAREQAAKFLYNGKEIRPTKVITQNARFLGAEYIENSELVIDANGAPLTWLKASSIAAQS